MRRNNRLSGLTFAILGASLTGGVAGCDALQPGGALLYVFSTHHATPEDGAFPDRGGDEQPRVFQTDEDWTITLVEAFITIEQITLVSCGGREIPLDMFWGPCPEDLRIEDLQTLTVAGNKVDPAEYCELVVDYGNYRTPEIDPGAADTRHETPDNPAVDGATVYLRGAAARAGDETQIPFELRGEGTRSLRLDLSEVEGGRPLRIDHTEDFPKMLTISKTYDRFLDGVDFEDFDEHEIESDLDAVLAAETRVQIDQQVVIDPP